MGFSEKLKKNSIAAHLDRGFYFKQMGLAKIDDAAREFRYVIFLDPDNTKANDALHELEKEAEESGVRLPSRATPKDTGPATAPEKASSSSRPSVLSDPADTRSTSRPAVRTSGTRAADKTRVLGAEAAVGATQVLESGTRRAGQGLGAKLWVPIAAVVLVAAALGLWKLRPAGGPAGAIALATQPPGAAVFAFAGGPATRSFAHRIGHELSPEKLADGPWEVRVELAGFRPQARRVEVAANEQNLSIALATAAQEGRFALATVPPGASVAVRRPGEGEFRALPGKTPLTSEPLAAGRWEVRAEVPGSGRLTRTVDVSTGAVANVKWDRTKEHDAGRVDVTSEPPGAAIRPAPRAGRTSRERARPRRPRSTTWRRGTGRCASRRPASQRRRFRSR